MPIGFAVLSAPHKTYPEGVQIHALLSSRERATAYCKNLSSIGVGAIRDDLFWISPAKQFNLQHGDYGRKTSFYLDWDGSLIDLKKKNKVSYCNLIKRSYL